MFIYKVIKYISITVGMAVFSIPALFANEYSIALVGATIFTTPEENPIENGVLILRGEKISTVGTSQEIEIPTTAEVIDMSGQYITSGFWNSHVHYTGQLEKASMQDKESLNSILLDAFLRWGFVNTVDTGSWLEKTLKIRDRIESGEVNGPRILIAGGSFVPIDGSPYYISPIKLPEFKDPNQARKEVSNVLNMGADAIKLFTGAWATPENVIVMQPDDVLAATTMAHEKGALVFAHPSDSDGARVAIENGVDILAHVFPSQMKGPWDRSLPRLMAETKMSLIPTLKLWRLDLTKEGLPLNIINRIENTAIEQTKACYEEGVTILFGTDVGYISDFDNEEEFRLLSEAGLNYQDILRSLTTSPAAKYSLAETSGKVKENYDADLVILGTDPRKSILAFSDVIKTIRKGKIVYDK